MGSRPDPDPHPQPNACAAPQPGPWVRDHSDLPSRGGSTSRRCISMGQRTTANALRGEGAGAAPPVREVSVNAQMRVQCGEWQH